MATVKMQSTDQFESEKELRLHIAGRLHLQNEFLSQALGKATGRPCSFMTHEKMLSLLEASYDKKCIILWDCIDAEQESLWSKLNLHLQYENFQFVLFNVCPEQQIETQAVKRGIRGIFYPEDSLSVFQKGIQAILQGHLWVSRNVLEQSLAKTGKANEKPDEKFTFLTFREREVLAMIAEGLSKDDIADELGISPHTVKTHTHNIYQKINVTSRIKAALWATQNLERAPKAFTWQTRGPDIS
ncbi:MAG: response regulator transcription factor [Proteobacteria bacterium]|nr:response regulator transcription factor [Pseudomonadota bacterium]MBU1739439.1 response regulator transcription factor [Pseudomonadota bacterium]